MPRDRQSPQDRRHHQGSRGVQEDVDQVVAERGIAPEQVFDPECAMKEGVVLERRPDWNHIR